MATVRLYGDDLFGRSSTQMVITGLNSAPGGIGGVDEDVQNRLGAVGAPQMVDRRHGICCGITLTWIIGFCHNRDDAKNPTKFSSYFTNVLRFQGAYLKDFKGNVTALDTLDGISAQGLAKGAAGKCIPIEFGRGIRFPSARWAAYLGVWHHAIGVGWTFGSWCIMDPNAGLFCYENADGFLHDLNQLCEARRVRKGEAPGAKMSYTFFTKA
jgi:hypothetical protein